MKSLIDEGFDALDALRARTSELREVWRDDLGARFEEEIVLEVAHALEVALEELSKLWETTEAARRRVDSFDSY